MVTKFKTTTNNNHYHEGEISDDIGRTNKTITTSGADSAVENHVHIVSHNLILYMDNHSHEIIERY
jgi:hypothetical protein